MTIPDMSPIEKLGATTDYMDAFRRGRAVERSRAVERVAIWMIANSFPTGHGDTIDHLLGELSLQIKDLRTAISNWEKAI